MLKTSGYAAYDAQSPLAPFSFERREPKDDDVQLYNLKNDLAETINIAADQPQIAAPMRQAIEGFKKTVVPGS